jgi:hypothetical protein
LEKSFVILAFLREEFPQGINPNPDISHLLSRVSLAPGFSPVDKGKDDKSRFHGFSMLVFMNELPPRDSPGF